MAVSPKLSGTRRTLEGGITTDERLERLTERPEALTRSIKLMHHDFSRILEPIENHEHRIEGLSGNPLANLSICEVRG
jgi:type II secretory pathway component PulJ